MTTRSRSKSARNALCGSLESKIKTSKGPAPASLEEFRAIPEVPNGPLVISAGWGRTGTSSLKVWPSGLKVSHKSAHSLHAPALQLQALRPSFASCRGRKACNYTLLYHHTCHMPSNTDMLNAA